MAHPAMPADVRELLSAILDAINIPHPATIGDTAEHHRVLAERAMHAVIALRSALDDATVMGIDWTTEYLRKRLDEHPPTGYTAWGQQ